MLHLKEMYVQNLVPLLSLALHKLTP